GSDAFLYSLMHPPDADDTSILALHDALPISERQRARLQLVGAEGHLSPVGDLDGVEALALGHVRDSERPLASISAVGSRISRQLAERDHLVLGVVDGDRSSGDDVVVPGR